MKIAIEAISAGEGLGSSAGGMIVYYRGLIGALCGRDDVDRVVTLTQPWSDGLEVPRHPKLVVVPCRGLPRVRAGRVVYEQIAMPVAVARQDAEVLLSSCNTKPLLRRAPTVVVLQSVQHLHFPESFGRARRAYLDHVVPLSLRHADSVIAVSEWERQEAIRAYGVDPDRIFTVHHGVSDIVRAAHVEVAPAVRPYVFMASTLYGFKNHRRLVLAFARVVREERVPHDLVLAGGDADVRREDLARLAVEEGVGDRVRLLGPVPHDCIPGLLSRADVVAYPSLCETFGHPILEALTLGCCVVTSSVTSMPEVAGDAAILVDPYEVDALADGLRTALLDEGRRAQLRLAGPARAASFTWERCAERTFSVLQFAVNRRG
jgi:glycosyltransferase involved in cell wall biosynthesis